MPATSTTRSPTTSKTAASKPPQDQTLIQRYEARCVKTTDCRLIGEATIKFYSDGGQDITVSLSDMQSVTNRMANNAWGRFMKGLLKAKRNKAKEMTSDNSENGK